MMWKVFLYASIFIAGFAAISLWNFYSIIRPPQIETALVPKDFGLTAEDVSIETDDGVMLSGLLIPGNAADTRALIILHGYPAEKSDMLPVALALHPDFSLLLLDMRSFGKSGGPYTTLGIKERRDVRKAADYLKERGYGNIGVFGFSLGGAVAVLAAADDERIGAVASYGSFANLPLLGKSAYRNLLFLKQPMVALELLWARILFRESLSRVSPENAARRLSIPVFIAHSGADEQIPFEHALRLKEALKDNTRAEFYFMENEKALHGELSRDFYTRLKEFFLKNL